MRDFWAEVDSLWKNNSKHFDMTFRPFEFIELMIKSIIAIMMVTSPFIVQAEDSVSAKMIELIDVKNDHKSAHELAEKMKDIQEQEFELWAGVAALGVGKVNESISRLEKFISNNQHSIQIPRARLELVKAYFQIGEKEKAFDHIDQIFRANPPENVMMNVLKLLQRVQNSENKVAFSGNVKYQIGRDSNPTGGVESAEITVPVFGNIRMNESGLARSSLVSGQSAQGTAIYQYDQTWGLMGQAEIGSAKYRTMGDLDQLQGNVAMGGYWRNANSQIKLQVNQELIEYERDRSREYRSLGVGYSVALDSGKTVSAGISTGHLRYGSFDAFRNENNQSMAVGYSESLSFMGGSEWYGQAAWSHSENQKGFSHLSSKSQTLMMGISTKLAEKWIGGLSYKKQKTKYDGKDPLFMVRRSDELNQIDASITYLLNKQIDVVGTHGVGVTSSNTELWEFKRSISLLKITYKF